MLIEVNRFSSPSVTAGTKMQRLVNPTTKRAMIRNVKFVVNATQREERTWSSAPMRMAATLPNLQ